MRWQYGTGICFQENKRVSVGSLSDENLSKIYKNYKYKKYKKGKMHFAFFLFWYVDIFHRNLSLKLL